MPTKKKVLPPPPTVECAVHPSTELELIQDLPAKYGGRTWTLTMLRCPEDGQLIQTLTQPPAEEEKDDSDETPGPNPSPGVRGTSEEKSSDAE